MDKQRLFELARDCVKQTFEDSLNYIEVVLPQEQYKKVRTRILRSGNNQIRKLKQEIQKYDVKYNPSYNEEVDFEESSD